MVASFGSLVPCFEKARAGKHKLEFLFFYLRRKIKPKGKNEKQNVYLYGAKKKMKKKKVPADLGGAVKGTSQHQHRNTHTHTHTHSVRLWSSSEWTRIKNKSKMRWKLVGKSKIRRWIQLSDELRADRRRNVFLDAGNQKLQTKTLENSFSISKKKSVRRWTGWNTSEKKNNGRTPGA